jgi:hypothetical protein
MTVVAMLLVASTVIAEGTPENWVTNGDFSAGAAAVGPNLVPTGWGFGWGGSDAIVAKAMTGADGGGYVRIRVEQPPVGGVYLTQTIPFDQARAGNGGFEFSCEVKYDNCTQGDKGYMTARVLLLYTTSDRVVQDHLARKFVGSSDWRSVYIPCKLPADTTQIRILLGFHTSQGTLSVRNVKLVQVDSPRQEPGRVEGVVIKNIAPGIVETDYGVAKTLKVGAELWHKLTNGDPAAQWYKLPNPDGEFDPAFVDPPDWTAGEQARGFVVYQHTEAMIAPVGHTPSRDQILEGNRPIKLALTPGETRSAVAVVYPLSDLPEVSIRCGDLASTSGDTITAGNLRVDHVQTMFYRANTYRQYVEMPRAIVRFDALDLPADQGTQFWIYCTAPDDAQPGIYEGEATILSQGRRMGRIPLRVEVYPFKLAPALAHWSMYYYYEPDEELPIDLAYMKSVGMNSVICSPPPGSMAKRLSVVDGQVRFDFTPDDRFMAAYKAAGYKRPVIYYPRLLLLMLVELTSPPGKTWPQTAFHSSRVPLISSEAEYPPAAREAYKQAIRLIVDHAREADWPEMILYLTDEPFEMIWREFETAVSYKLAKQVAPEIKTYCTVYPTPLIEKYGQYIDYISSRGLQRTAPSAENADFLEACKKTGSRPWASSWPPLWWHNYWYARAYAGFVNVRSGFEGNNIWFFQKVSKGLGNPFKSLHPGGSAGGLEILRRTKTGEHENPTIMEGIREGILDARYIATLKAAINKAKQAGRDVAAHEKELDEMIESAPTLRAGTHGDCWDRPGLADAGDWSVAANEQLRQRIARMIIALKGD